MACITGESSITCSRIQKQGDTVRSALFALLFLNYLEDEKNGFYGSI
jgi:hypothetical protein